MPLIDTKRLFFAAELPELIKESLYSIQSNLKKTEADVKWTEIENMHITLKFLGNTPLSKLDEIKNELYSSFSKNTKLTLTLKEIAVFPSLNSPRIIWAGFLDPESKLYSLAGLSESLFEKFGFKKETKNFQAHTTIGRIRTPKNKISLTEKLRQANQKLKPQDFVIDKLSLFESRLTPQGPEYSTVQEIKLI